MSSDLKKFVNPRFLQTIDLTLILQLFWRHFFSNELPINFDADKSAIRTAVAQYFEQEVTAWHEGVVADLHRIADLGSNNGMQIILNEARRQGVVLYRDPDPDDGDPAPAKHDPKHVALETYLYRHSIFKAAADFHALRAPAALAEFRGPERDVGADLTEEAAEAFESAAMKLFARDLQEAQVIISGRVLRRIPEREIDRLLRGRVLIEQRKADSWSVCSYCDCGLDARPIRKIGGQLRACCPHDVAEDELLEPDDLRRFRIDADRLTGALAASAGLAALARQIADGLWLLGRLPSGRCLAPGADVCSLGAPRANLALRSATGTAPTMAITSEIDAATGLRLREAGVEPSPFKACIAVDEGGTEHLTAGRILPGIGTPRLVLSRGRQSSVLDGRRLDLPPQMFALFRLLTEQAGRRDPVLRKATIDAETGRPANEIVRDLRRTLGGCGLTREEANALVATVRSIGYRLGLEAAEIAIED